jgi:hypothetical protein
MIIQNSTVSLFGNRTYRKTTEETEKLNTWIGSRRPDFEGLHDGPGMNRPHHHVSDTVDLSRLAKGSQATDQTAETGKKGETLSGEDNLKILLIERFVLALTGKRIKIGVPGDVPSGNSGPSGSCAAATAPQTAEPSANQAQGWGARIRLSQVGV